MPEIYYRNAIGWPAQTGFDTIADDAIERIRQSPEKGLRDVLVDRMSVREHDILARRFGIEDPARESLARVARRYGLTRERIRQIEVRTLERLRRSGSRELFTAFLETQTGDVLGTIVQDMSVVTTDDALARQDGLTGLQRLAVKIAYGDIENWLDRHMEAVQLDSGRAGWIVRDIAPERRELFRGWFEQEWIRSGNLVQRVRQIVRQSNWPLTVNELARALPDVSGHRLSRCLREDLGAVLEGDRITAMTGLTTAIRLVLVLRRAGRPLHVRDVQSGYQALFGGAVRENAARVALQRQPDVVIVSRGVYAHCEHLPLGPEDYRVIVDAVDGQLVRERQFMSAKILRRNIASRLPKRIDRELTPYLVLGICQKDPRFVIRRGLMIGLAGGRFAAPHVPLSRTVIDTVREHGPISIADIRRKLSDRRDLFAVSVNVVLQNAPEITMVRRGLYGVREKVIGDADAVKRLEADIRAALAEGPANPEQLARRLGARGYSHGPVTILSVLRHMSGIALNEKVASLPDPDPSDGA